MSDAADAWDKYKLLEQTNGGDYHPTGNPGGWESDGHEANLRRWSQAVAAVGKEVRNAVATATSAANQAGAWKRLEAEGGAAVAPMRLAADQFAVPGDWTWLLTVGRAVRPAAAVSGGWIAAVTFEAGNNRTVATVTGWSVPADITELWFGQDLANAPKNSPMTGATASVAGSGGTVPAPSAAQNNNVFYGDGTFRDPAVDAQIWG